MTVPAGAPPDASRAPAAAVDGSTPRALAAAEALARGSACAPSGSPPRTAPPTTPPPSMASNFLVTLEGAAERLAATAGVDRDAARPAGARGGRELGGAGRRAALTGPIARGDEATVARHRAAVAERTPDLLPLFDALADATRALPPEAPA